MEIMNFNWNVKDLKGKNDMYLKYITMKFILNFINYIYNFTNIFKLKFFKFYMKHSK